MDGGRLLNAPEILELLDGVKLHHGGWQARCPAHEDRSPSLSIAFGQDGRTLLTCYAGCQTEDVVAAVGWTMRHLFADHVWDGLPAPARPAPRPRTVPPEEQVSVEETVAHAAAQLASLPPNHPAIEYAHQRFGVTRDHLLRLRVGYASMAGGARLVVPFCDTWGTVRGWQARALREDARARWLSATSPTEGEWLKAGWFRGCQPDAPICVTEGPGDALSAVALGFHAIAIRGSGLASNAGVQDLVRRWVGKQTVILCGDGDEAGERFNKEFTRALGRSRARVTALVMSGGDDLSAVRARGQDECRDWMLGASGLDRVPAAR